MKTILLCEKSKDFLSEANEEFLRLILHSQLSIKSINMNKVWEKRPIYILVSHH